MTVFQSTHPSGVRRVHRGADAGHAHFNPRTPVGCDPAGSVALTVPCEFQSTHPSGVRRVDRDANFWATLFQSTHPSGVRPRRIPGLPKLGCISIHAPQWGATVHDAAAESFQSISIHAPQWGATSTTTATPKPPNYFNPRTPVGCDPHREQCNHGQLAISIHAPQWGATGAADTVHQRRVISIHAPQWGATCTSSADLTSGEQFQSTHPSGVRLGWQAFTTNPADFNPRTPVGCDRGPSMSWNAGLGFQSTHPSGVRLCPSLWRSTAPYFNPRTPVGCDVPRV